MANLTVDFTNVNISAEEMLKFQEQITDIHEQMQAKANDEKEFLGWLELPTNYDKEEVTRIKKASTQIMKNSDVLVVLGIGGSYLGARAVIDALTHSFYNMLPKSKRKTPEILYAGNNFSPNYLNDLIDYIGDKDFSINVVSKSGTTAETAIAFRIFKELLEKKYGVTEAKKRIYATTDRSRGALKTLCNEKGYETFVIPDNIGGRYSVLTAVGLLPIAIAGIDIEKLLAGAKVAQEKYATTNIADNVCYQYAIARNILYKRQKKIEIFVNYEPKLHYFNEWLKQLFGESEGKENKGIFPAGVDNSTDLHSMGQYIQQGERSLFETVLSINHSAQDYLIKEDESNLDGLNYLAGKGLDFVNKKAMEGTVLAHTSGEVPNILINLNKLAPENLGELIYFFEKACAVSGLILEINPFDQPGVEEYKKNMFKLLGKPDNE